MTDDDIALAPVSKARVDGCLRSATFWVGELPKYRIASSATPMPGPSPRASWHHSRVCRSSRSPQTRRLIR